MEEKVLWCSAAVVALVTIVTVQVVPGSAIVLMITCAAADFLVVRRCPRAMRSRTFPMFAMAFGMMGGVVGGATGAWLGGSTVDGAMVGMAAAMGAMGGSAVG